MVYEHISHLSLVLLSWTGQARFMYTMCSQSHGHLFILHCIYMQVNSENKGHIWEKMGLSLDI